MAKRIILSKLTGHKMNYLLMKIYSEDEAEKLVKILRSKGYDCMVSKHVVQPVYIRDYIEISEYVKEILKTYITAGVDETHYGYADIDFDGINRELENRANIEIVIPGGYAKVESYQILKKRI